MEEAVYAFIIEDKNYKVCTNKPIKKSITSSIHNTE
jgi:hypothetical protein